MGLGRNLEAVIFWEEGELPVFVGLGQRVCVSSSKTSQRRL
jgi:hypothetical protein